MKKIFCITFMSMFAVLFFFTGCPQPDESNNTGKNNTIPDISKVNLNGNPVFNYLYIETVTNDPRVAMGYVLDDGKDTPFFDMVILFNARMRNRNCALEQPSPLHSCTKNGFHLHFDGNIQHVLANRGKYIKPLQDKGIKVSLCLLPEGDAVTWGTLGSWPMEDVAPVANNPEWNGVYPYDDAARLKFFREVADAVEYYGLDGVDFDDEYGSKSYKKYEYVWPDSAGSGNFSYYTGNSDGRVAAWERTGENFARCIAEIRDLLGPDRIITVYDYKGAQWLPKEVTHNGVTRPVRDILNFAGEALYGTWVDDYSNGPSVLPRSQYAPVGIDLGGVQEDPNLRVLPSYYLENGIKYMMPKHLEGNYGANLLYNLLDRGRYDGTYDCTIYDNPVMPNRQRYYNDSSNTSPQNNMPEVYLSVMAKNLYGYNVKYIGQDYPQDWKKFM